MNREDNDRIVNARVGGRRSTDMDKITFQYDPLIFEYLKDTSMANFMDWYYRGEFYKSEFPLKKLLRLYRKRSCR